MKTLLGGMNRTEYNNSLSDTWWNSSLSHLSESNSVLNTTEFSTGDKNQLLVYDFLIPVLGVVIIVINSVVVISSGLALKKGMNPKATYMFLGNLALSDVLIGITVLVGQFYPDSLRSHTSCLLLLGIIITVTLASSWSIALIGIDRFVFIVYGLYYNIWMTTKRAKIMIGVLWIKCFLVGFSPAMGWSYPGDGSKCWYILVVKPANLIFTVIIGIFLPLGFVAVLYIFILFKALHQADVRKSVTVETPRENIEIPEIRDQQNVSSVTSEDNIRRQKLAVGKQDSTRKTQKKWKALKVVLFTLSAFIVSWFPYFIASFIYAFNPSVKLAVTIASVLAVLGFLNSFLNPLIYAWWHRGLRNFIKEDCFRQKRKRNFQRSGTLGSKASSTSTSTSKVSNNSVKSTENEPRNPESSEL
ncbi:glucose-dependent insulinotropic receptor-like [Tachypleus tridentatus]|uniref:glucose-dependent insulinotropic receptor-like n=1 Tax=Tachypleus tridentatus TaxID=6853 RepID=UPI003FD428AF